MGRTNPTYRDFLRRYEQDWQPYRRALRRQYQADFDRLFERAAEFSDAAGYHNATNPELAVLMSILLSQEVALRQLHEELSDRDDPTE